MVTHDQNTKELTDKVWRIASTVPDPELPMLNIQELNILREVKFENGVIRIYLSPTYSGCPAYDLISAEVERNLTRAGISNFEIVKQFRPAWTTDTMSDATKQKLRAAGIAPPTDSVVRCPRCGTDNTRQVSRFGATACKALWNCNSCREPFEHFKRF